MAANKARYLVSVTRANEQTDVHVRVREESGAETEINLPDIPRAELCRLVYRLGLDVKRNGQWRELNDYRADVKDFMSSRAIGLPLRNADFPRQAMKDRPVKVEDHSLAPKEDSEWIPLPRDVNDMADSITADTSHEQVMDTIAAHNAAVESHSAFQADDEDAALIAALKLLRDSQKAIVQPLDEDRVKVLAREQADAAILDILDDVIRPTVIQLPDSTIIGKLEGELTHQIFAKVMQAVSVRVPVALVGPAGSGKSTLAKQVAHALNLPYADISLSPDTMKHEIAGFIDAGGTYRASLCRPIFQDGGVFLWDEMDTVHAGIFKGVNKLVGNGEYAFPDALVNKHADCIFIGAMNTFGTGPDALYVGGAQLDASSLDRWVRLPMDYDKRVERQLVRAILANVGGADEWLETCFRMRQNVEQGKLRVVVSPRLSIDGAKLITAGWSREDVCRHKILDSLSPEQARKVAEGVTF